MFKHTQRITNHRKVLTSGFFLLSVLSLLVSLTAIGSMAAEDFSDPISEPKAVIQPQSNTYAYTASPKFDIDTGSNTFYKVELALAKVLFPETGNRILSGENQNFYSSGWLECSKEALKTVALVDDDGCTTTYELTSGIWINLRGSVVFYRVLTNTNMSDVGALSSTVTSDTFVNKTGEAWYGLPHNDQAKIGNTDVVVNGRLNGRALASDYGPRNVTGGSKFHPGLDIPVAVGHPVYAIANGTVVSIPTANDSMHRLDIDHGNYRTGYVHLDKWLVSQNEEVRAGQLIGYSGDWVNGQHQAAHLHFDSGYATSQIYHNPLDYLSHTDDHTVSTGTDTFLGDNYTHNHAIDVVNAAGNQHKVLIAFGITTSYDKDLNYVKVQVDNNIADGQNFELDYDDVTSQNSSNGVVTLSSGKTFRIRPLTDDIYGDTNLAYAFYVKPADTNVNLEAKDYFFFPWNVTPFKNDNDGGHHTIQVTLREVDGNETTRTLAIGPEISVGDPTINGNQVTYELSVTNHDYENGNIGLSVLDLPPNWTASFSNNNPLISAGGSATVALTLTAPGSASTTPLFDNKTKVVATFGRISALKDAVVLCPGEVNISSPTNNDIVEVNTTQYVFVEATKGATSVELQVNGVVQTLETFEEPTTWMFKWDVPGTPNAQYQLQAFGTFDGSRLASEIVNVVSNDPTPTGIVWISQPSDGDEVPAGETYTIEVGTDPAATKVDLKIDGVSYEMTSSDGLSWVFDWQVPSGVEKEYQLQAVGIIDGGSVSSSPITVNTVDNTPDPYELEFREPQDGASVQIGQKITIRVYAPDTIDVNVDAVSLSISPADQDGGGNMTDAGSGMWTYDWTPQPTGGIDQQTYTLVASAYDTNLVKVGEELIQVYAEGVNPTDPWIEGPTLVLIGAQAKFTAKAPQANRVTVKLNGNLVCDENASECVFIWVPRDEGKYTLLAEGYYQGGVTKNISMEVEAKKAPAMSITSINEYAFLGKIEDLDLDAPLHNGTYTPLPISSNDYACGIVGYEARGGDIGEHVDYFYTWVPDAIGVFLTTDWYGNYQLVADINTIHWSRLIGDYDEDRPEIWDVTILCVSNDMANVQSLTGLGDNVNRDTGIAVSEKICGIGGFWAHGGDIQENDDGDIIRMFLYRQAGNWHLRADFRTHKGSKGGNEDWDVNLLCLDPDIASLDGPIPSKPFFLKEYTSLGDNIHYPTEFAVEDWTCGIVGFAGRDGDIDEGEKGSEANLFLMYMYEDQGSGKWRIRADFRTHKDHENWNVNVLCVHKDLSAAPEILSATSTLFTTRDTNNILYGPGMALTWNETYHPDAKFYEIQFSEDDGTTWQTYTNSRDVSIGGWINHHGNLSCGFGFGRCLKRLQSYSYRVRVLDAEGQPITDWSEVYTATSMEWPAHVEIADPSPPGPYSRTATVTLQVENAYGKNLWLEWDFRAYGGASYSIRSGCQSGYLNNASANTCKIHIKRGSTAYAPSSVAKFALLEPAASVVVKVAGTDSLGDGYTDRDEHTLNFSYDDPPESSFGDVPPEHWAFNYIEYIHDMEITSGCTTVGEPKYCPENNLERSQMAVFMVRSRHLEEPGYVPPPPEKIIFIDEEPQSRANIASTAADPVYREEMHWYDKYFQELYDDGVISGCSMDPMKVCPNDATTRAQMTVLAVRLLRGQEYTPPQPNNQVFNDVLLYDAYGNRIWSTKWITTAHHDGLIQACGTDMVNMRFHPDEPVTRAEAACMIYHALEAKVK